VPKSATFRTADIVGLDILVHVVRNLYDNVPQDESRDVYKVPALIEDMLQRGWLGEKTGKGFYQRVKKGGESEILTLDWPPWSIVPARRRASLRLSWKADRRYPRALAHPGRTGDG